MSIYSAPVCRGSWALGNNCRTCERCIETRPTPPVTDTPNELVERVARAISGHTYATIKCGPATDCEQWENMADTDRETYRAAATAAIEASGIEAQQAEIARLRLQVATIQQCCEDAAYSVTMETKADDPFVKVINQIHAIAERDEARAALEGES